MKSVRVGDLREADLSPASGLWERLSPAEIRLEPTPLKAASTSRYLMHAVPERAAVKRLWTRSANDGRLIAIHIEWEDGTRNDAIEGPEGFVDAASVSFPIREAASAMTMGSERSPINAWYWRADEPEPFDIVARGIGTTIVRDPRKSGLKGSSSHSSGRWRVVFTRPLSGDGAEYVDLSGRETMGISFAVWEGQSRERGAIKSTSGEFRALAIGR